MDTTDRSTLEGKLLPELQQIAQDMGIEGSQRLRKSGLIDAIVDASNGQAGSGDPPAEAREAAVATVDRADEGGNGRSGPTAATTEERRRGSSTSCPTATGSCGPPGTCPVRRTSTSRCRRCASTSSARATS
jgi:hypothetical protein